MQLAIGGLVDQADRDQTLGIGMDRAHIVPDPPGQFTDADRTGTRQRLEDGKAVAGQRIEERLRRVEKE
jgi:hypothetical protein